MEKPVTRIIGNQVKCNSTHVLWDKDCILYGTLHLEEMAVKVYRRDERAMIRHMDERVHQAAQVADGRRGTVLRQSSRLVRHVCQ